MCGFQELTGGLQDVLTEALEHIRGQETGVTALKLAALTLEGSTQVSAQVGLVSLRQVLTRLDSPQHFHVSGGGVVYSSCYGQGAEQLPALATGSGGAAQKESGHIKEPQDLTAFPLSNPVTFTVMLVSPAAKERVRQT